MTRLLIRHPEIRPYRVPFFERINDSHSIKFLTNTKPQYGNFDYRIIGWPRRSLKFLIGMIYEILKAKYDVFVASLPTSLATITCIIFAKCMRKKVVIFDVYWPPPKLNWRGKIRRRIAVWVYHTSDAVFAAGSRTRDFALTYAHIPSNKVFFALQSSIDFGNVPKIEYSFGIPDNAFTFLFLGRILKIKGLDYLIRAFEVVNRQYSDAFLLVVGEGPEFEPMKLLAETLNLRRYRFFGAIPDDNKEMKKTLYCACDTFILPSIIIGNYRESWGLVIAEAISTGMPIITTDAVGCSDDLVQEGINGFIVKNASVEELAFAMMKMIDRRGSLSKMKATSRKIFEEKLNYENMAGEFLKAVDYAIN